RGWRVTRADFRWVRDPSHQGARPAQPDNNNTSPAAGTKRTRRAFLCLLIKQITIGTYPHRSSHFELSKYKVLPASSFIDRPRPSSFSKTSLSTSSSPNSSALAKTMTSTDSALSSPDGAPDMQSTSEMHRNPEH